MDYWSVGLTAHSWTRLNRLVLAAASKLRAAATVDPPTVRSLDAIHLVSAIELRAAGSISAAMTFDRQLDSGLAHHGIRVLAPIV